MLTEEEVAQRIELYRTPEGLRELVREAYEEGFDDGFCADHTTDRTQYPQQQAGWKASLVKAILEERAHLE